MLQNDHEDRRKYPVPRYGGFVWEEGEVVVPVEEVTIVVVVVVVWIQLIVVVVIVVDRKYFQVNMILVDNSLVDFEFGRIVDCLIVVA